MLTLKNKLGICHLSNVRHLLLSLHFFFFFFEALDSEENEQAALNCVNDSQVFTWKPADYMGHFTISIT